MEARSNDALRYEWRAWGDLPAVGARLCDFGDRISTQDSIETYLLAPGHDGVNPKLRDGALDVKVRREVRDGFEKWEPLTRAPLPIAASAVRDIVERLGATPPELAREAYTQDQLVAEVVAPHPDLTHVAVNKSRQTFDLLGCTAEWGTVSVAGGPPIHTIAVESADLPALRAARDRIGLDAFANEGYPAALQRAIGGERGGADHG